MPKKILICTGIFPPDIGGPATMLEALSHELRSHGFAVKILTYAEKTHSSQNVIRVKKGGLLSYPVFFLKMLRLSFWADLFYITETHSVGYFAYLIKKIVGQKYILRFAGDGAWETALDKKWTNDYLTDFQKKTYDKKIERLKQKRTNILTTASEVITVSRFLSNHCQNIGVDKNKIHVIYNSIDFMEDKAVEIDIKAKYPEQSKIITTICRLIPGKGIDTIIKILPEVMRKVGRIDFLILGDGPEHNNLQNLSNQLGLHSNVHFLGRVEHKYVISYLKASDLFILNTSHEGFSHAILEAMNAGAPILSTKVGGNPETVENGSEGLLVEFNNQAELKNAMIKILSDGSYAKQLADNAKIKYKTFNWQKNISATIDVINKVI